MANFHVTKNGRTEPCTATVKACPLGEANHFNSAEEAIAHSMSSFTEVEPTRVGDYKATHDLASDFVDQLSPADVSALVESLGLGNSDFEPAGDDDYLKPDMSNFPEHDLPWEQADYEVGDGYDSDEDRADYIRDLIKYPYDTPLAHHWIAEDVYEDEVENASLETLTMLVKLDENEWLKLSRNTHDYTDDFGENSYYDLEQGKTIYQRSVTDDHYSYWFTRGMYSVLHEPETESVFEEALKRRTAELGVTLPKNPVNAIIDEHDEHGPWDSTLKLSFKKLDARLKKMKLDEDARVEVRAAYVDALSETFDQVERGRTPGFGLSTM